MSPWVVATSVLAGTPSVAALARCVVVVVGRRGTVLHRRARRECPCPGRWPRSRAPRCPPRGHRPRPPSRSAANPDPSDLRSRQWYRSPPAAFPRGARMHVMAERQRIASGSPFEPTIGFSRARAGGRPAARLRDRSGPARGRVPRRRGTAGAAVLRDHPRPRWSRAVPRSTTSCGPGCSSSPPATPPRSAPSTASCWGTYVPPPPWSWWRGCWTPPGGWRSKPRRSCPRPPEAGVAGARRVR